MNVLIGGCNSRTQDAIAAKSFYTTYPPGPFNPPAGGLVKGDVDAALKSSAHVVSGTVTVQGQKHFYMETQNCVAELVDDGTLDIQASTQVCVHAFLTRRWVLHVCVLRDCACLKSSRSAGIGTAS